MVPVDNVKNTPETLTLTVLQTAKLLRLSKNGVYEAVARGQVPSIRIGRRVLIPRLALERMLEAAGTPVGTNKLSAGR